MLFVVGEKKTTNNATIDCVQKKNSMETDTTTRRKIEKKNWFELDWRVNNCNEMQ
jgi:hypothetical protein